MPLSPLVGAGAELDPRRIDRVSRNLMLPGIGSIGQRRLAAARVLVIGAGGLGSPVIQYLAAAGVGTIGIVDFDTVDVSNLQRQVIHRSASVGEAKTASAARAVAELDASIVVRQHPVRLDRDNALDLFDDYDLVVDGSDNFATRYLANDAAALRRMPYVWGSVLRFDGQVTVFWEGAPDAASLDYRDLHPLPPAPGEVLSCDEAGVLGAVCGVIGSLMATEAVKLITGTGHPLLGRVLNYDALAGDWRELRVTRRHDRSPVSGLMDYEEFCGVPTGSSHTVTAAALLAMTDADVVDVREPHERELRHIPSDRPVPLRDVLADPATLGRGPVVVYCETGARSGRAVDVLRAAGVDAVSLAGGIRAWSAVVGEPVAG